MKKLLSLLVAITLLYSCSKDSPRGNLLTPYYVGTYVSTSLDTVFTEQLTEPYSRVTWTSRSHIFNTLTFDSVIVASDSSFVVSQLIPYTDGGDPFGVASVIGSGRFGTNTIQLHFVINTNRDLIFNGVKHY